MEKACGEFQLKRTHNYFFQVQQQLITLPERNYNDFVVCAFDSNHCGKDLWGSLSLARCFAKANHFLESMHFARNVRQMVHPKV